MLPKSQRFTKKDFTGKRPRVFFRSDLFDVAMVILPQVKYSCVISKKTLKRAVDRNRAKRRIMGLLEKSTNKTHYSLIFYPKKIVPTISSIRLKDEIMKVFDTLE